jgi:mono/diheme cytochrome c family protein/cytochrome c553
VSRRLLMSIALMLVVPSLATAADPVDFDRDIWPILESRCVACHGPKQQKSSLRLDSRGKLLTGGDTGPAIVPGDAAGSLLIELVTAAPDEGRMPPKGDALTPGQVDLLKRWIQEGASWPQSKAPEQAMHWAFQRVQKPAVPAAIGTAIEPIDAFILAKLHEAGLKPSPASDPRTFLRRVTLDLIGLPPTAEDLEAFIRSCGSSNVVTREAAAEVVDRLLASPRYGERWAQHWLDVIRYADTTGYEKNGVRKNAWPYRDYVIEALNKDLPYNEFVRQQLAGDALGIDPATGFLVTPPYPEPIEVGQEPAAIAATRFNSIDEVIQNLSSAVIGMSIGCARCHDHKFDPVSARDYYRLAANFAGLKFDHRPWETGNAPEVERRRMAQRMTELRAQLREFPNAQETEPTKVTEVFSPVRARWIRMTITETPEKKYGPAVDEFEVWQASDERLPITNVARGGIARSSGNEEGVDSRDEHLNDGKYGARSLWVSDKLHVKAPSWIEIELPESVMVDRVTWSRDPLELDLKFTRLSLRTPKAYTIEIAEKPGEWRVVARHPRSDSLPEGDGERRQDLEKQFAQAAQRFVDLSTLFAGSFTKSPATMHVLRRGDPMQPKEPIAPGGIEVLGNYELSLDADEQERRLKLAEWLVDPAHPLTSRVIVNRVWQHHFGIGIVATPSDFGTQGERPTHPELLDWLAADFMEHGWSLKRLHRQICTSETYMQSSDPNAEAMTADAQSRLLWRFPPRRLEAEAIRDTILALSGSLDLKMGGPGANIYDSKRFGGEWRPLEDPGPKSWRRTIYLLRVRGADDGVFKAFDVPDCGQVRAKRSSSTTPLQALNLFNSAFVIQQAERLAERIQRESGDDPEKQVETLFRLVLLRSPNPKEQKATAEAARGTGLATVCRVLLNCNEFLMVE